MERIRYSSIIKKSHDLKISLFIDFKLKWCSVARPLYAYSPYIPHFDSLGPCMGWEVGLYSLSRTLCYGAVDLGG